MTSVISQEFDIHFATPSMIQPLIFLLTLLGKDVWLKIKGRGQEFDKASATSQEFNIHLATSSMILYLVSNFLNAPCVY